MADPASLSPGRWEYPIVNMFPDKTWLDDVHVERRSDRWWDSTIRLLHTPTGVTSSAGNLDAVRNAITDIALQLVHRGDITVNQARRALQLPEWRDDPSAVRRGDA